MRHIAALVFTAGVMLAGCSRGVAVSLSASCELRGARIAVDGVETAAFSCQSYRPEDRPTGPDECSCLAHLRLTQGEHVLTIEVGDGRELRRTLLVESSAGEAYLTVDDSWLVRQSVD